MKDILQSILYVLKQIYDIQYKSYQILKESKKAKQEVTSAETRQNSISDSQ